MTLTPEHQQEAREAAMAELINGWCCDVLLPRDETVALAAYAAGLARGRAEERERCASMVEEWCFDSRQDCADAIRAAGAEEAGS